jgi:hypothetical protein
MIADSSSDIAWHRVQLKKNRDAVKALEIAHFRMGHITGTNELALKNIAVLKRKIAESERYISGYERRTKRPVATDVGSLANVSSWSSWNTRRAG